MLYSILMAFQVLVAVGIIALVLLQHGKGADAGAAFGSGASATVFGARGSGNFLSRTTAIFAFLFFVNSLALAYLAGNQTPGGSVVDTLVKESAAPVAQPAPEGASDIPEAPAQPQGGSGQNGAPADVPQ